MQAAGLQIAEGVGPRQYGAGKPGGASLEVAEVRAETLSDPTQAIVTLDGRNAFGAVRWCDALRVACVAAPKLAHVLAAMWRPRRIGMWLQNADGIDWHCINVVGSLFQGGHDAHPVFCLLMAVVLARASGRTRAAGIHVLFWCYVDDISLKCDVDNIASAVKIMEDELAVLTLNYKEPNARCTYQVLQAT